MPDATPNNQGLGVILQVVLAQAVRIDHAENNNLSRVKIPLDWAMTKFTAPLEND